MGAKGKGGVKLEKSPGKLAVKIMASGPEFKDYLTRIKMIPGRRWNPDNKTWELPDDPDTLMRAVYTLQPNLSPEVMLQVRTAQGAVAEELVNDLPEDGDLLIPWADRMYKFQRACVEVATECPKLLICDDMGLGKTLEAQSAIYEILMRAGKWSGPTDRPKTLVIAANSNLGKWSQEYDKWVGEHLPTAPGAEHHMLPTLIDGKTPAKREKQVEHALAHSRIAVVNWEKLPAERDGKKNMLLDLLRSAGWDAIIADEIHRAKNKDAQQTLGLHSLHAPIQLGLTGTPIMTNPADLWSPLHWMDPITYNSYWKFFNDFAESYAGYEGAPVVIGVRSPDKLRFQIGKQLVRRTKSQVGIELPDKTREFRTFPMKAKQAKMYEEAKKALFMEIKRAVDAGELDFACIEAAWESGDESKLEATMKMIPHGGARYVALRKIAVSPALLGEADDSSIMDAMVEIVKDAPGKQFVIWGWHQGTVELAAHRLRKLKPSVVAEPYHGGIDRARRDELIDRFQSGSIQVLCCTIKAGGVGSDFQNSDTSIFLERSSVWVDNEQAEDRQHRIGQDNAVTVIVLGSEGTVQSGRIEDLNALREGMNTAVFGKAL